ncbi:MAG: PD-(D/E)XK nuclease family protein [Propionibacteriaceae bacterium]|nr:PD-(D/E)XK nuclease family protein [Propionibacteriaceae bacterium]
MYASQAGSAPAVRAFFGHVADFAAHHENASLAAFVAYLDAEEQFGSGLAKPRSTSEDAVAIMTVHRAKGLEWDRVYLPGVVEGVFPDERVTDNPLTAAAALPTALRSDAAAVPQLRAATHEGLDAYKADLVEALARSEDRLAYVALTRARHRLVVTAHRWAPGVAGARGRSRYVEQAAGQPGVVVGLLAKTPERAAAAGARRAYEWPAADDPKWREAAKAVAQALAGRPTWESRDWPAEVRAEIAAWDGLIEALATETARRVVDVEVPTPLATSRLLQLEADPQAFAADLARPLPHAPSRRSGLGARFHAWVEQYYRQSPIVDERTPDRGLARLRDTFLASPFAAARPAAVEFDFVTQVAGHAVSGRIDAVFRADDNPSLVPGGKDVLIVDWKTGAGEANPRQLAVYAEAWAGLTGVPLDRIAAGYFYLRRGTLVPAGL